ncbi:MAG: hypothetical protein FJZ92_12300 [Chloroflexi bacterium]|nr:hypothetical protein [Chloroflexota bacterium]
MLRRLSLPLGVEIALAALLTLGVAGAIVVWQVGSVIGPDTEQDFAERVERARELTQARLEALSALTQIGAVVVARHEEFA